MSRNTKTMIVDKIVLPILMQMQRSMMLIYFELTYITKFYDQTECEICKLSKIYGKDFNTNSINKKILRFIFIDKESKMYLDKNFLLLLM